MAIYYDIEGNTPEWHALRVGLPTSSEFSKIVTPKTLKLSSQAPGYMAILLAEWITGQASETYQSEYMQRGIEMEDAAYSAFELITGEETQRGGFITDDAGTIGCSPDRLIGSDGDLELKCPALHTQVRYALEGIVSDEYKAQLQGRLMIHQRSRLEIFPYHPRLPIPPVRVYPDETYIGLLGEAIKSFTQVMIECRARLQREFSVRPTEISIGEWQEIRHEIGFVVRKFLPAKDLVATPDDFGVSDADVDEILANAQLREMEF